MIDRLPATMAKKPEPRFENANMLRMFPSLVWKAALRPEVCASLNETIFRALPDIGAPLGDLQSGESWQSGHDLHDRTDFKVLVDCIEAATETVVDHLRVDHEGFQITGCWANLNAPGAEQRTHGHPNNYLSGVYYVRVDDGADTINFHDPSGKLGSCAHRFTS